VTDQKPCYFANDHSRDELKLELHEVEIHNARLVPNEPSLEREGFILAEHRTEVSDFRNADAVQTIYAEEIRRLVLEVTGADHVEVTGGGVLRFGESSAESKGRDNSLPARFIHVDISEETAALFAGQREQKHPGEYAQYRRYAHYNVWRTFSPPPQDVPLALCESASVEPQDLIRATAYFDAVDKPGAPPLFGFEGFLLRYNPRHRWFYFPDMDQDEALVFKTFDSDYTHPCFVPHTAFDDPSCPAGVPPRASIEMRAVAFFKN